MKSSADPEADLIRKVLRPLPIDPLPQREWDFSKCPTWQHGRCWEYELWRESKEVQSKIAYWRKDFPKWVDARLRADVAAAEWEKSGLTKQNCEAMYPCIVPKWLLIAFPEFPLTPYLAISPASLRVDRLRCLGCTPQQNRQILPLDTRPITHVLGELAEQSGLLNLSDLPPAFANPTAHIAAARAKIAEALIENPSVFENHQVVRKLGKEHYIADVVFRIPWRLSNRVLLAMFKAWLENEGNRPPNAKVMGGSGSTSDGDRLRKLGAFRLLRHCRGNWELAADMSARFRPNGKALYEYKDKWDKAATEISAWLENAFTSTGFTPIR